MDSLTLKLNIDQGKDAQVGSKTANSQRMTGLRDIYCNQGKLLM
jgi:hypothetical protein